MSAGSSAVGRGASLALAAGVIWVATTIGCSGKPDPDRPNPPTADARVEGAGVGGAGTGSGNDSGGADPGRVSGAACAEPRCVYHAGASAHYLCLASVPGACTHYGGPCAPSGGCAIDPTRQRFARCAAADDLGCTSFAGECAANACVWDAGSVSFRTCERFADGVCGKWGSVCAP